MDFPLYIKEIWLFKEAIDFRKGKASLINHILKEKKTPNEGLYLFINKRKDKIKGLCWHKNGFLVIWKELEKGKFVLELEPSKTSYHVNNEELVWLLAGLPWQRMKQWGDKVFQKFS